MIKKALLLSSIFFISQLLLSCIFGCNCPKVQQVESVVTNIEVHFLNKMNQTPLAEKDSLLARNLLIKVNTLFEEVTNACNFYQHGILGFNTAYACDCIGNEYYLTDSVDYIKILVSKNDTAALHDVSASFGVWNYNDSIPVNMIDFFSENAGISNFEIELLDINTIPNTAIFTVELYLQSGIKFSYKSELLYILEEIERTESAIYCNNVLHENTSSSLCKIL